MRPEIPACFYRVSVKALILDETRTKFMIIEEHDGVWELPGGGLDWGEKPLDGLTRELNEEMGLKISEYNKTPVYFITMLSDSNVYYANIIYEVKVNDLSFIPSKECVSIKFVTTEEASSMNILPNVREFIKYFDPENHRE